VTWQTSESQLAPTGHHLLERLAWFAPEPIPNVLLDMPGPDVAADSLYEALANLADFSLAQRNSNKQEFSIHRLVQDVTRRSLSELECRNSLAEALAWMTIGFAGDPKNVRSWPRLDPLIPHVYALVRHADAAEIREPTAGLMNQLGILLRTKARYTEAEPLLRRALAIFEKSYGPDHPEVALRLNDLAGLLQATNRLGEAEPLLRRALAILEKSYSPDHPDVAPTLNYLAEILLRTNRLGEAEPLLRRALAIDEKSYGPNHPEVAPCLNNLASLLRVINRLEEAEPLHWRALAICVKSYGPDDQNVALCLNNLAVLLRATNRLGEAELLVRQALPIC
jgi:tetratricopeptide (TPR) repeat protein